MKLSKFSLLCLTAISATVFTTHVNAQSDNKEVQQPSKEQVNQLKAFMNLPEDVRKDYVQKAIKAKNLFSQKRIFDTLELIGELEDVYENHPSIANLKGSCYTELRAFDKAHEVFSSMLKRTPNNPSILFNLAELAFIQHQWQSAHDQFSNIIDNPPSTSKDFIRISEFKVLICNLKLNKIKEAEALRDKYDDWDDSPYFYMAKAAHYFHHNDKEAGRKEVKTASKIWNSPAAITPWIDTLQESGYMFSLFGKAEQE